MWSNEKPSEDGHYWHVIEHYVNGELEKRYGPSLVLVKIEEDDIDGGYDVWIDYIGSDDGDYLKFTKDEMITERVVPRDPIFGWDTDEAAKRKAKDLVKRKWVYWFKPLPEAYFDPENKSVDPYPVLHQKGSLSVETNLEVGNHFCDTGVQIARDGRIWICVDGHAFLRFKPISESHMEMMFGKETGK